MKMPRDIDSNKLIKILKILDYQITRQAGSHIRLSTILNGQHHLTIPNHKPFKIGTLSKILSEIAIHFEITKEELMIKLFIN
jgi:predicted RNA binding protein YcfA (HicA-like mRNA interferase family)